MSNQDNVIVVERGRPYSDDINDLQSMQNRLRGEILRWMLASSADGVNYTDRSCVLGGLTVEPDAAAQTILVNPGVLAQVSSTLLPLPTAADSIMRIGRLEADEAVVIPVVGSLVYYVLEAQVVPTNVTITTDQLNTFTGQFNAISTPVRQTYGLAFQLVAGAPGGVMPTPTGGNWIAIAGIRKAAGSNVLLPEHIYPLANRWGSNLLGNQLRISAGKYTVQGYVPGFGGDDRVYVQSLEPAYSPTGLPLTCGFAAGFAPGDVDLTTSGTVFAANTWYYVYMAPWNGLAPVDAYRSGYIHAGRGLCIVSNVVPTASFGTAYDMSGVRTNSAPLTLGPTAVWATTVATNGAICVGAILRNAANNGWVRTVTNDGAYVQILDESEYVSTGGFPSGSTSFTDLNFAAGQLAPRTARGVRFRAKLARANTASTTLYWQLQVRDTGAAAPPNYVERQGTIAYDAAARQTVEFDMYFTTLPGTSFSVLQTVNTAQVVAGILEVMGFYW